MEHLLGRGRQQKRSNLGGEVRAGKFKLGHVNLEMMVRLPSGGGEKAPDVCFRNSKVWSGLNINLMRNAFRVFTMKPEGN